MQTTYDQWRVVLGLIGTALVSFAIGASTIASAAPGYEINAPLMWFMVMVGFATALAGMWKSRRVPLD